MTDKMREEFEKWHMERYGGFGLGRSTEPGYTGEYERVGTNLQWVAWQAARTVPDGFVMVPVEPTREMVMAGYYPDFKYEQRIEMYKAMLSAAPEAMK